MCGLTVAIMEKRNFPFQFPNFRNRKNDSVPIIPLTSPSDSKPQPLDPIVTHPSPSKPMMISSISPRHSPLNASPTSSSSPRLRLPANPFLNIRSSGTSPSLAVGGPPLSTSSSPFRMRNNEENSPRVFGNPNGLFSGSSKESFLNQTPLVNVCVKEEPLQVFCYFFGP